jgi:hypothetical protein
MPGQVAAELEKCVCLSGGSVSDWALIIFRPFIIEGVRGLICVRGTKTAVGSAESVVCS